jgi:predicted ATP-dependent protease
MMVLCACAYARIEILNLTLKRRYTLMARDQGVTSKTRNTYMGYQVVVSIREGVEGDSASMSVIYAP